ncbi:Dabb family protein [Paenibacillus protaetiae]|uniref:Dabb family protein n=2 Tax=Paenibacillus protaetiae TaxID=2509456 RepID=A0A4P6EY78_9BACL|nr:Dabb family protein [Paenibacillus protaetiae]QAY68360.1 Dabb family protein [Paenibacillus protaetiae]
MVIFNLKHEQGSAEAEKFLADGQAILASIPTVSNFGVFSQTSVKNPYQYGFSMDFASQADYDFYNEHPSHTGFVKERWELEVTDFLEIDFQLKR